MKIKFNKIKKQGLYCRFCGLDHNNILYETSPIKGIVCGFCKRHLENYII